jgi:hypothetical protein
MDVLVVDVLVLDVSGERLQAGACPTSEVSGKTLAVPSGGTQENLGVRSAAARPVSMEHDERGLVSPSLTPAQLTRCFSNQWSAYGSSLNGATSV